MHRGGGGNRQTAEDFGKASTVGYSQGILPQKGVDRCRPQSREAWPCILVGEPGADAETVPEPESGFQKQLSGKKHRLLLSEVNDYDTHQRHLFERGHKDVLKDIDTLFAPYFSWKPSSPFSGQLKPALASEACLPPAHFPPPSFFWHSSRPWK